ncbi:MAG: hypothetical protein HFF93_04095 [Oscillibacter sp.]|nr:hypothetical protein [Oscillibacter sp.]
MKKQYDTLIIGPVSLDHNIDYQGNERKEVGGAVVASGFAAAKSGNKTALFTKLNPADADVEERLPDKTMAFHDWAEKREYLPCIDYLKTDAAEAEILTGLTDRAEAAKLLHSWGAKEVLITHNTEVLAYDGERVYTCPIKARNLSGRTGRGDTTFAGYITERQRAGVEEALLYCTALVSLKMETPGPFQGSREDVENYISEFY